VFGPPHFRRRAFVRFSWTAASSSGWSIAHRHRPVTGSRKALPNSVRSYSTLGRGYTCPPGLHSEE
jgi:hypothetical protein